MGARGRALLTSSLCVAVAVVTAGCQDSPPSASAPPGVTVSGAPGAKAVAAQQPLVSAGSALPVTSTVELTPSGPLTSPATVVLPLTATVPSGATVFVETVSAPGELPTVLPATVTTDGKGLQFTTSHFSWYSGFALDLRPALTQLRSQFLDPLTGNAFAEADKPRCDNEAAALQDGYAVRAQGKDALVWCLGVEGGRRVLKVVNTRRYPLSVAHPGLTVAQTTGAQPALAMSLSRLGSGQRSIVAPRGFVTFSAELKAGTSGSVQSELDGFGQSLWALQMGVEVTLEMFNRFGQGAGVAVSSRAATAVTVTDALLSATKCSAALPKGPVEVLASCFSPGEIAKAFGAKVAIAVVAMVVLPVIEFLRASLNVAADQVSARDASTITLSRKAAPAPRRPNDPAPLPDPLPAGCTPLLATYDAALAEYVQANAAYTSPDPDVRASAELRSYNAAPVLERARVALVDTRPDCLPAPPQARFTMTTGPGLTAHFDATRSTGDRLRYWWIPYFLDGPLSVAAGVDPGTGTPYVTVDGSENRVKIDPRNARLLTVQFTGAQTLTPRLQVEDAWGRRALVELAPRAIG